MAEDGHRTRGGTVGYLAVLAKPDSELPMVERCHLNLWALPGWWPGRRLFYFDIGLILKAPTNEALSEIQLLLPFAAENANWGPGEGTTVQDLFPKMRDDAIAELIFGEPVTQTGTDEERILTFADGPPLRVLRIDTARVCQDFTGPDRPDLSLWTISMHRAIGGGERGYVRMRWRVYTPGSMWRWARPAGTRSGATVDLRVNDVREGRDVARERNLRSRIAPIGALNVFVMVSRGLRMTVASPTLRYIRTLEGENWQRYLAGTSYRGKLDGSLVHYWRYPEESKSTRMEAQTLSYKPSSPDNPFRAFLELAKVPVSSVTALVFVVLLSVLLAITAHTYLSNHSLHVSRNHGLADLRLLGPLTLLGIAGLYNLFNKWLEKRGRKPRALLRRVERHLLRKP
jgi:hypothetical protein